VAEELTERGFFERLVLLVRPAERPAFERARSGVVGASRSPGRRDAADWEGWANARKFFSFSEKYAEWADG
jgi:hypothetical protein